MEANDRSSHADRLQRLGVPPAASRAYVALVELGETEAREIARLSGIPFAKVYSALDELTRRGLATVILDSPRRFAPKPVDSYLSELQRAREREVKELAAERESLATLLAVAPTAQADDRGTFTLLRGRTATVRAVRRAIDRAERDVLLLSSAAFPARAHIGAALARARSRSVRVRLLALASNRSARELVDGVAGCELRTLTSAPGAQNVAAVVADGSCAVLAHLVPDDGDPLRGHDVGLATSQSAIALSLRELLEVRWSSSAV
jgi:sugar-specific transcriptional regulator TrmB